MGACASQSPEDTQALLRSKAISTQIKLRQQVEQQTHKLLLLGAGESGKSTLFKHMTTLYDDGFSDDEKEMYRNVIYSNIIVSVQELIEQTDTYGELETPEGKAARDFFDIDLSDYTPAQPELNPVDEKMAMHIHNLWNDPGMVTTFENRSKFQLKLNDTMDYFVSRIDAIAAPDYLPNDQDVLRCRIKTTGIMEKKFSIDGSSFNMFDVGGQRSERKKWIHCFQDVKCVIFVAAISEYDQVLIEDPDMNRLWEALNLFGQVTGSQWFLNSSLILFLNKSDLYLEKIKRVPITVCFPDYDGEDPNDFEDTSEFIRELFEERAIHEREQMAENGELEDVPQQSVFCHVTCATDPKTVSRVFNAVKEKVLLDAIRHADLIY